MKCIWFSCALERPLERIMHIVSIRVHYAAGTGFRIGAGRIFMIRAVKASCVTMHKCMDVNTASDCLYSTLCCSEGLEDNPDLLAWIPREPELSPEWWSLLGEFNNQFEELMTERFRWQNPRGGARPGTCSVCEMPIKVVQRMSGGLGQMYGWRCRPCFSSTCNGGIRQ
jgi:hypothetical protein